MEKNVLFCRPKLNRIEEVSVQKRNEEKKNVKSMDESKEINVVCIIVLVIKQQGKEKPWKWARGRQSVSFRLTKLCFKSEWFQNYFCQHELQT